MNKRKFISCWLVLLFFSLLGYGQNTYVVNTTDDINDGTCDATHCSLREALNRANADGVASDIHFNIAGTAPFLIQPNSGLPNLWEGGTTIDGSTQPNWQLGDIVIDGTNVTNRSGLRIREVASDCNIFGLKIQNFDFQGIRVGEDVLTDTCRNITIGALNKGNILIGNRVGVTGIRAENFIVQYNYLGTDENFSNGLGNLFGGVECRWGDQITIQHNYAGNNYAGIGLDIVKRVTINNNYLGTDTTATKAIGNSKYGILCNKAEYITIKDNWIGHNEDSGIYIECDTADINHNLIGTDTSGVIDMGHFWYGIYIEKGMVHLAHNSIAYNRYGIRSAVDTKIEQNSIFCNSILALRIDLDDLTNKKLPPVINTITSSIEGTSEIGDTVEVFLSDQSECTAPCQGKTLLGRVVADAAGNWSLSAPDTLMGGDQITATATNTDHRTSEFAVCQIVLPDECTFSEAISVHVEPCNTVGTVLDLKQLTTSTEELSSSCSTTFAGNDAWFKMIVPATGNLLIRTNINNTVVPVFEAYTGTCDTPILIDDCTILDSLPFAKVFENYTPGTAIYLRVWDKDNALVNSPSTALLHITAHELDLQKDNWRICDQENNLINGNPTILSEKDANSFILEYEASATPAEIAAIEQELMDQNASLVDACLCNGAPLQLWKADNPIEMEDRRKGAKRRANVDTTNYNYIFETVEFQVNSYAIGQQFATDVAMDAEGNFAMVWSDEQRGHNYGRVYRSSGNPITQEFQIGATEKRQFASSIAMDDSGDFTLVWHEIDESLVASTFRVYGRQYNADGTPKAVPFEISLTSEQTVPSSSPAYETARFGVNPKIDLDANGNFVVVWHVDNSIFAQRFNSDASLLDTIIHVGIPLNNVTEPQPAVAVNNVGEFVLVWTGLDNDESGIFAQRYDNTGMPVGNLISVNTHQANIQAYPDVALQEDGSFIVVWESYEQEGIGLDYGVFGQRFDNNGNKLGSEFAINSYTTDAQRMPNISLFEDGTFAVAWSSLEQDGFAEGIYAKLFDALGNPIAPAFDDSANGSQGEEFRMNTYEEPEQERPKTATNGTNILIGAWEDGANDGSFKGIFAQRYEVIDQNASKLFYPIGTATPSTLLGDQLDFSTTVYDPDTTNKVAKVAIIDTGIESNHPNLVHALWTNPASNDPDNCVLQDVIGYDFVNEAGNPTDIDGHGTRVNGMLARDFATGVRLELMNLKFHEVNRGSVFDAICAIYYAVDNGADILNLSWGFEASEFPAILNKALKYASDNDVLIVTTAGNTSKDNDRINKFPANLDIDNMIVVTAYEYRASNGEIRLANYASYGQNTVDIAAHGFVESPTLGGGLDLSAGTSLAAPLVARTAAIIKGLHPALSAADIKDCILSSATAVAALSSLVATGGILNHEAALACAADKETMLCNTSDLSLSATVNEETCLGNDGSITVTVGGSATNPTFFWSRGDMTQNLQNVAADTYQLIAADDAGCPDTLMVTVPLNCNPGDCNMTDAVINDTPIAEGTYHSDNTLESAGTIAANDTVTFKAVDLITLKPNFHAMASAEFKAMIADCGNTFIPVSSTARNQVIQNENANPSMAGLQLKLIPNPTSYQSQLHFYLPKNNAVQLVVFSTNGQKILDYYWQEKLEGWHQETIDVQNLVGGIYYVFFKTNEGIRTEKLMVLPNY